MLLDSDRIIKLQLIEEFLVNLKHLPAITLDTPVTLAVIWLCGNDCYVIIIIIVLSGQEVRTAVLTGVMRWLYLLTLSQDMWAVRGGSFWHTSESWGHNSDVRDSLEYIQKEVWGGVSSLVCFNLAHPTFVYTRMSLKSSLWSVGREAAPSQLGRGESLQHVRGEAVCPDTRH